MLYLYILIFITSCFLLAGSGTWLVNSLIRIAKSLGWREFIASFILIAFIACLPEFFVGISSAFHHKPQLSFGNVIGSNIIKLTLAIAIGVLLAKGLRYKTILVQRSSVYTAIIALLPVFLMLDGKVSRIDGLFLLFILIFYFKYLFKEQKRFTKVLINKPKRNWAQFKLFLKDLGMFLGGIFILLLSAEGVVWSALSLASFFGLSLVIVGSLIVAIGTTLPEIVFGLRAVAMGHKDMLLGTLMGSVIINSTLVLGSTVLIYPLEIIKFSPYIVGIIFTMATCLFFAIFSRTGREITRKEAVVLIGIYILFVFFQLVMR